MPITLNGSTSGQVTLEAPAIAGTTTITLPASSGALVTSDGSGNVAVSGDLDVTGKIGAGGSNYGTAGQVLTSGGSGSAPSWQDAGAALTLGTPYNANATTNVAEYTGLPSGIKRIMIQIAGVRSPAGSSIFYVQIGTSGGYQTSGYTGRSMVYGISYTDYSTSFRLASTAYSSANTHSIIILNLTDETTNTWTESHMLGPVGSYPCYGSGQVALSGSLDRVKIAVENAGVLDGGFINIMYE